MFTKHSWLTPKRLEALQLLDLHSPEEVLSYFPRRYADYSPTPVDVSHHQQRVVVHAHVVMVSKLAFIRRNFNKFTIVLSVNGDEYKVPVFNRPFLYRNIKVGTTIVVAGKLDFWKHEISGTDIFPSGIPEDQLILPLYRLKSGVSQHYFKTLLGLFLKEYGPTLVNILPDHYRLQYDYPTRAEAFHHVHHPLTHVELARGLQAIKYEEFFVFNLRQLLAKNEERQSHTQGIIWSSKTMTEWVHHLPYALTEDQHHAISEIHSDLKSSATMYRLLQGDVGSGKTVVAASALYAVALAGCQSVLMAPTEILARQHFHTIQSLLKKTPIRIELLTGSLTTQEKTAIYQRLQRGECDIVIGTHAVFQEKVLFKNLRLAIIDEQHRFGVDQRLKLKQKGIRVDILMLSATPIPRTLAMSIYGDMDISTLSQFPSSKRQVKTTLIEGQSIKSVLPSIEQELAKDGRLYVICPLIESEDDEETISHRSAIDIHQSMSKHFAGRYGVGIIHGQQTNEEKNLAMKRFQEGLDQVLVATTVVEVGVDVKAASQMVIYDAESFGLSQLHQLRGRIGRAGQSASCYVLTTKQDSETRERLAYFCKENDGFELARYDLEHRGPGDLLGLRQSGFPEMSLADFQVDMKLLDRAQKDALDYLRHQSVQQWSKALRESVEGMVETMADVSTI